jgi:hypothetical protein
MHELTIWEGDLLEWIMEVHGVEMLDEMHDYASELADWLVELGAASPEWDPAVNGVQTIANILGDLLDASVDWLGDDKETLE